MQQQPSDITNGNGYIRVPISPYPDEISYSMHNSVSVPAFQTNSSDVRHRIRSGKSTEGIENEFNAIPGCYTNLRNSGQNGFTCHDSQCSRCIPKPKRAIEKKLEVGNKELKAILREVRVITDKVRDEVFLAKYLVRNFQLKFSYQILKFPLFHK